MGKGCCKWEVTGAGKIGLLGFAGAGDTEGCALLVVGFNGGGKVEIGERNLQGVLRSEIVESLSDDRVVGNFLLVLITEDEDRAGHDGGWGRVLIFVAGPHGARGAGRVGVCVLIAVGFFLAEHTLLFQILAIHLGGCGDVLSVVVGVVVPIPVRIVEAIGPRVIAVVAAAIAVAVVAESVGAEAIAAEAVMQEGTIEAAVRERRAVTRAMRRAGAGVHAAGIVTGADVAGGRMAGTESAEVAARGVTASAVLRPEWG